VARFPSVPTDLVPLEDLIAEAQKVALESIPENTKRAYKADWKDFTVFCEKRRLSALPAHPEHVCAFLSAKQRTLKRTTLRRRLTVIGIVHRMQGYPNPLEDSRVRQTWKGILRSKSEIEERKAPLLLPDIKAIAAALPESLAGIRDKALILLGFAGAFRRSELVALNVANVELTNDGLVVHIPRGKTDQLRAGRKVGSPMERIPSPVR